MRKDIISKLENKINEGKILDDNEKKIVKDTDVNESETASRLALKNEKKIKELENIVADISVRLNNLEGTRSTRKRKLNIRK